MAIEIGCAVQVLLDDDLGGKITSVCLCNCF